MSPLPHTSYPYRASWDWFALALLRGALLSLILLILLWAGVPSTPEGLTWLYGLQISVPAGLLSMLPAVSVEQWATQRQIPWPVTLAIAFLSVFGAWTLGLLLSHMLYQAFVHGTASIGPWVRTQLSTVHQNPKLWLVTIAPPFTFALAAVWRTTVQQQQRGAWLLLALTLPSFSGLFFLQGKPLSPLLLVLFLQVPTLGVILTICAASDIIYARILLRPHHS